MVKSLVIFLFIIIIAPNVLKGQTNDKQPNIVLAIADDWGYHASVLEASGIDTPTFDQLSEQGYYLPTHLLTFPVVPPLAVHC
ncbi:MAG: hypothetical protein U5K69_30270 [Balneolaceae bacterium]|nr:hypothetical protein [Balneolaceae bacterium]